MEDNSEKLIYPSVSESPDRFLYTVNEPKLKAERIFNYYDIDEKLDFRIVEKLEKRMSSKASE